MEPGLSPRTHKGSSLGEATLWWLKGFIDELADGCKAKTQSPNDNSAKIATTAYVDTGLADKADTSDLDDYLPLSGGTMTGAIGFDGTTRTINHSGDDLTYGGKEIKSMAFPSATNINISTSATSYTAPADGYISAFGKSSSTNGVIQFQNNFVIDYKIAYSIGEFIGCTIPMKKGQTVNIGIFRMTISWIRFTYSEGEV